MFTLYLIKVTDYHTGSCFESQTLVLVFAGSRPTSYRSLTRPDQSNENRASTHYESTLVLLLYLTLAPDLSSLKSSITSSQNESPLLECLWSLNSKSRISIRDKINTNFNLCCIKCRDVLKIQFLRDGNAAFPILFLSRTSQVLMKDEREQKTLPFIHPLLEEVQRHKEKRSFQTIYKWHKF